MTGLTHDEIEGLLGAYALDAIDDDERGEIERHLRSCPRCRAEVAEHREVAALLANSGARPPEGMWDRIAGSLEQAPPDPPGGRPAPVIDIVSRRKLTGWRVAAGAVAVAAAVVIGILGFEVSSQRRQLDELVASRTLASEANAAFAAADSRTAELASADGTVLAVAVVREDGQGYLVDRGLPALSDRIYQLWGVAGDSVISLGPMGGEPSVVAFHAGDTFEALVVTEEARPVEATSNPPFVQGELA